ncbi:MAG: hypothetical protein AABW92_04000, partial [Nanoarchaeota archaeon]
DERENERYELAVPKNPKDPFYFLQFDYVPESKRNEWLPLDEAVLYRVTKTPQDFRGFYCESKMGEKKMWRLIERLRETYKQAAWNSDFKTIEFPKTEANFNTHGEPEQTGNKASIDSIILQNGLAENFERNLKEYNAIKGMEKHGYRWVQNSQVKKVVMDFFLFRID